MENEATGFKGSKNLPGFYLDLANGQYDTYTNLQVAQYISTIANTGSRYKVKYLKSIKSFIIKINNKFIQIIGNKYCQRRYLRFKRAARRANSLPGSHRQPTQQTKLR